MSATRARSNARAKSGQSSSEKRSSSSSRSSTASADGDAPTGGNELEGNELGGDATLGDETLDDANGGDETETGESPDGRRARKEQNRKAVMDAVLDLWKEGDLNPEVSAIAQKSGVSERSVFRYFDDVSEMQRAAIEHRLDLEAGLFELPDNSGVLKERVERFVELRMRQFDVLAPVARVAFLRAPFEPRVQREIARRRDQIRSQARHLFGEELREFDRQARVDVVAAIEVMASFESVEFLRTARGMSPTRAARVVIRGVESLLKSEK